MHAFYTLMGLLLVAVPYPQTVLDTGGESHEYDTR